MGCVYVAELARRAGRLADESPTGTATALARVGLPTTYAGASFEELHARDEGGQEVPRLAAAVRGARRPGATRPCSPGRPRPTCAAAYDV